MNSLILDVTPNVLPIACKFTNANWEGILRDLSLKALKTYWEVRTTGTPPYIHLPDFQELQWRYGFEKDNAAVLEQFVLLYQQLYPVTFAFLQTIEPTKLLTVVRVTTANNIFQLHLGYA